MISLKRAIAAFIQDEDGAAASEYAVLVALIVAAVATAVAVFDIEAIYTEVNNAVTTAMGIGGGASGE